MRTVIASYFTKGGEEQRVVVMTMCAHFDCVRLLAEKAMYQAYGRKKLHLLYMEGNPITLLSAEASSLLSLTELQPQTCRT